MKKEPSEISFVELLLKDRELHTPKSGYELVCVDDYEFFGEQLYAIGNFETLEEALAAKKKVHGVKCMIYDSKGNVY